MAASGCSIGFTGTTVGGSVVVVVVLVVVLVVVVVVVVVVLVDVVGATVVVVVDAAVVSRPAAPSPPEEPLQVSWVQAASATNPSAMKAPPIVRPRVRAATGRESNGDHDEIGGAS